MNDDVIKGLIGTLYLYKRAFAMTKYELLELCKRNPNCDCKCVICPLNIKYIESNYK